MGTSLTGLTPATTYDALIKVGDNGPIDATLKALSDGLGNNLPMEVSTETVNFTKGASANQFFEGLLSTTASGTQVVLTINSVGNHLVTGSGGQTFKLPDATTLPNGAIYYFNNNQSSGAISVNNNSNTLVASIPSGGFTAITLLSNATAAGTWERHEQAPSNVSWSTNTFDYPGSITSATWNGVAIADAKIASAATWNAKQNAITGAATTITTSDLTVSRALVSNASGKVAVATTTSTELGYVSGVTSSIQTQIDAKQPTITGGASTIASTDLTVSRALISNSTGKVAVATTTSAEIAYVNGVTSPIQSQIDAKTNKLIVTNRQTASYTLVLSDADKLVETNVASANNLTVPLNSSVAFATGTQILLAQYGAGQTTIVATSGVTIRSNGAKLKLNAQYSGATLIKIDTNEWYLFGDIA
jgi:hypothetical protein